MLQCRSCKKETTLAELLAVDQAVDLFGGNLEKVAEMENFGESMTDVLDMVNDPMLRAAFPEAENLFHPYLNFEAVMNTCCKCLVRVILEAAKR